MDKLEEHIRKHRDELDVYIPPSSVRRNIIGKSGRKPAMRHWYSIAAMIIVILGTSLILFRPVYRWSDNERNKESEKQLKETEIYYTRVINTLYSEAIPMLTNKPEVKRELNIDLSSLDSISAGLKKDLKDNISNKDVIEALILNYRIKIRILEDMLTELRKNNENPQEKKNHEL
jgi:hypothetical protein